MRELKSAKEGGRANCVYILLALGADLNDQDWKKESVFSISFGFARSVGIRRLQKLRRSIHLVVVAVQRKQRQCRSLDTLTDHGAAAVVGARQTARILEAMMARCAESHGFAEALVAPSSVLAASVLRMQEHALSIYRSICIYIYKHTYFVTIFIRQ
jgi:hypothetical protein